MAKVTIELDSVADAEMLGALFARATTMPPSLGMPYAKSEENAPVGLALAEQASAVEKAFVEKKTRAKKTVAEDLPTGMPEAPTPSTASLDDPLPDNLLGEKPEGKPTIEEVQKAAEIFYETAKVEGLRNLLKTQFNVSRWRDVPEERWVELLVAFGARKG